MDNHTFTSLAEGWQLYRKCYRDLDPVGEEHIKRAFMMGASAYDSVLFRTVAQLGPDDSKPILMGMHDELHEYAQEKLTELNNKVAQGD